MTSPLVGIGVFALAIAAALLLGRVSKLLVIPALLLGGTAIGPHGLGILRDPVFLNAASDVGLVLLLFYTSLFSPPRALRDGGRMALPLAAYDLVLNFAAAYWIGALFGWDLQSRLVLAGVITTSSTGAVLKILDDEGRLLRREGTVLMALLWIEDLAFVGYYIFLNATQRLAEVPLGWELVGGMLAFAAYLGLLYALRERIWHVTQREILIPFVTSLGVLGAWLGGLAGLPYGGAAFLTGLLLAGSRGARFVQTEAPYLRDVSAATFFLAFGTLVDPRVAVDVVPVALAALVGLVITTFIFLPRVAHLLGLNLTESMILGSSLLARGGKSASFARLGATAPAAPQIQGVAGLLALILTPVAPLLVRAVLWRRRRTERRMALARADVVSQITRRVLAPGEYAQRHLVPWPERLALTGWFVLPFLLAVLGMILPLPWRILPIVVGLALLPNAYRAAHRYFRAHPGTPAQIYRYRHTGLPRLELYLPPLLLGPCLLALLLPLVAPWATVSFPLAALATLVFILLLPRIVQPHRSAPYVGVRIVRPSAEAPRLRLPARPSRF